MSHVVSESIYIDVIREIHYSATRRYGTFLDLREKRAEEDFQSDDEYLLKTENKTEITKHEGREAAARRIGQFTGSPPSLLTGNFPLKGGINFVAVTRVARGGGLCHGGHLATLDGKKVWRCTTTTRAGGRRAIPHALSRRSGGGGGGRKEGTGKKGAG